MNLYTSIDLGSHSIKIVVSEKVNDKFYVLASTKVRSMGIKKGIIKDKSLALESIKQAVLDINNSLGIEIKKVLLNFPLFSVNTSIETSEMEVDGVVTGECVSEIIKKTVIENIVKSIDTTIISISPIHINTQYNSSLVNINRCNKIRYH